MRVLATFLFFFSSSSEVGLVSSIVLASGISRVIQLYICILFQIFFPLLGYCKILSRDPWAIQYVFIGYLFYI